MEVIINGVKQEDYMKRLLLPLLAALALPTAVNAINIE